MNPGAWRTEVSVARSSNSSSCRWFAGSTVKTLISVTTLLVLDIVVMAQTYLRDPAQELFFGLEPIAPDDRRRFSDGDRAGRMSSPCPPPARFWTESERPQRNRAGRRVLAIQSVTSKGASCLSFFRFESGSSPALGTSTRGLKRL